MSRQTKTDRLVIEAKKAYRATDLYKVEQLFKERSRWQRKLTIATNKLHDVQRRLDYELIQLATPQPETKTEKGQ